MVTINCAPQRSNLIPAWHDGSEMTAEDVAYSINRYVQEGAMAGQTSPRKDLLGPVTHAEAVDTYTVHVHMSAPWTVFLPHLVHHMVVPKSVGDGSWMCPSVRGLSSSSSGCKAATSCWNGLTTITGARPGWAAAAPRAERVVFRVIPETATRLARSGRVKSTL